MEKQKWKKCPPIYAFKSLIILDRKTEIKEGERELSTDGNREKQKMDVHVKGKEKKKEREREKERRG